MPSLKWIVFIRLGGGEGVYRPGLEAGVLATLLALGLVCNSILSDDVADRSVSHDAVL